MYKFAERQSKDQEFNDRVEPIANICNDSTYSHENSSELINTHDQLWRWILISYQGYYVDVRNITLPKLVKQTKANGKINNEKANMLLDYRGEVSIIDSTIDRKVGYMIEESRTQECVGIGENAYLTIGSTKIKITLDGLLV